MSTREKTFYGLYILLLIALVLLNFYLFSLTPKEVKHLISEHELIEKFSAIGYFMVSAVSFALAIQGIFKAGYSSGIITMILGLRELDFQAKFTTIKISKTSFYVSPEVPILEKLIVCVIVGFILFTIFKFVKEYFSVFVKDLLSRSQYAIFIFTALILLPSSKLFDRYKAIFKMMNWEITPVVKYQIKGLEESFELAVPYFLLLAVFLLVNPIDKKSS